jgi:hypothetical protein
MAVMRIFLAVALLSVGGYLCFNLWGEGEEMDSKIMSAMIALAVVVALFAEEITTFINIIL